MPTKRSRAVRNANSNLQTPVLVLNAVFEPCSITTVKRAMVLLCKEAAVVQDASDSFLHTSRRAIPVPSVIRLLRYRYVPRRVQPVSRKGIFLRDNFQCQYCQQDFPAGELTIDHVVPSSRGGLTSWGNCVCSCRYCNTKKGDKSPEEAGMALLRKPSPLGIHAKHRLVAGAVNSSWDRYLFC